jgi:hypothetical protein
LRQFNRGSFSLGFFLFATAVEFEQAGDKPAPARVSARIFMPRAKGRSRKTNSLASWSAMFGPRRQFRRTRGTSAKQEFHYDPSQKSFATFSAAMHSDAQTLLLTLATVPRTMRSPVLM